MAQSTQSQIFQGPNPGFRPQSQIFIGPNPGFGPQSQIFIGPNPGFRPQSQILGVSPTPPLGPKRCLASLESQHPPLRGSAPASGGVGGEAGGGAGGGGGIPGGALRVSRVGA